MEDKNIWRNIISMGLTWAIIFPLFIMETQYEQIYLVVLGATPSIVGLIYGAAIISLAFARLIGGYLSDNWGRKRTIFLFTYLAGFIYMIPAFVPDWRIVALSLILINISLLFQPAIGAILADSTTKEWRGRIYSVMNTLSLLVTIPAPLLATQIIKSKGIINGMMFIYFIISIGFLISGLVRHLGLVETLELEKIDEANNGSPVEQYLDVIKFIFKKLRWPLIASVVMFVSGFAILNFTGIYISEYLEYGREYWGEIYFYGNLITVFIVVILGTVSDKIGREKPILATLGLYPILIAPLALGNTADPESFFMIAIIAVATISTVNNLIFTVLVALEADLTPNEIRGKTTAILALFGSTFSAIFQIAYGFIFEVDPEMIYIVASIFAIIGVVILSLTRPSIDDKD